MAKNSKISNSTLPKYAQEVAQRFGLRFYKKSNIAFGNYMGYDLLMQYVADQNNKENKIIFSLCACKDSSYLDISTLHELMPAHCAVFNNIYTIYLSVNAFGRGDELMPEIQTGLDVIVSCLREGGFASCDENGTNGIVSPYRYHGELHLLTSDNAVRVQNQLDSERANADAVQENYLLGILGAVGGSILGGLVVLLIARIGYISAITSVIFGGLVVFGYIHFGKKISVFSAIFTAVWGTFAAYIVGRLDCAMDMQKLLVENQIRIPFSDIFRNLHEIMDYYLYQDGIDTLNGNLAKIVAVSAISAIVVSFYMLFTKNSEFKFQKCDAE